MSAETETKAGLALLREPFKPNQISKLPKPTKKQTDEVKADYRKGIRCQICGQWHHKDVVHLDYVGHAALTDRLLDADPHWNWEPVAWSERGGPAIDENGGMWIKLTVCGQTRLGYGHPDGKRGGDAIKEVIGDALRNAAMRFGAALDLWHKGDLHIDDGNAPVAAPPRQQAKPAPPAQPKQEGNSKAKTMADEMLASFEKHGTLKVAADPRFKADLEWLRDASPEDFNRVYSVVSDAEHDAAVKEY